MKPAPIAVFMYRRPDHLRRMLGSLARCEGFDAGRVVVFGDGPRGDQDARDVDAARAVARELLGSRATYRYADGNRGLAPSIISGVSELAALHGHVIVVEDDLEFGPDFLAWFDHGLATLSSDERVLQISGYMFDVPEFRARREALYLPLTTTWGWATWRRAWRHFDQHAVGWQALGTDSALRRRFNLDGAYDYASMLERQMAGLTSSWGIRWYWSVFKSGGLVAYPPVSRVRNRGFDGSGTHGRGAARRFESSLDGPFSPVELAPVRPPSPVEIAALRRAVFRQNGGWKGYAVDRLRRFARVAGWAN